MVKEKYEGLSSNDITKLALIRLENRNCIVWRQNQIPVRGRRFIGKKGQSDIMGFQKCTGLIVACEVKKIGDTLSDDQICFLASIKASGGLALVAVDNMEYDILLSPFEYEKEA